MKIKIIGIENDVHIKYEGTEYVGRRIHYIHRIDGMNCTGTGAGCQFLNDRKFGEIPLEVEHTYYCDRNYGKLSSFEEYPSND